MADEPVMTPISPEEGSAIPPKANPFGAAPAAAPAASAKPVSPSAGVSTIRLKPVIRKPMIHKPTVGVRPPVVTPAAKPAAPAPAAAAPAAAPASPDAPKKSTQNLKSVTGPIPAQAVLRKTGIIAEGILTPAQQQAAKSKTSRISLESAIGVAPVNESSSSAAPLKTIRLRRPTDLKPQPLKPAASAAPSPMTPAAKPEPAPAPVEEAAPAAPGGDSAVTQKKTLKLHRPNTGIKRPVMGASAAPASEAAPADGGDVPEIADIPDIADIKPMPMESDDSGSTSAGVPGWLAAISLVAALVALLAAGLLTFNLYQEGAGPNAGAEVSANEMRVL